MGRGEGDGAEPDGDAVDIDLFVLSNAPDHLLDMPGNLCRVNARIGREESQPGCASHLLRDTRHMDLGFARHATIIQTIPAQALFLDEQDLRAERSRDACSSKPS